MSHHRTLSELLVAVNAALDRIRARYPEVTWLFLARVIDDAAREAGNLGLVDSRRVVELLQERLQRLEVHSGDHGR